MAKSAEGRVCGKCAFSETDGGFSFCDFKPLFTKVDASDACTERDPQGSLMFAPKVDVDYD